MTENFSLVMKITSQIIDAQRIPGMMKEEEENENKEKEGK